MTGDEPVMTPHVAHVGANDIVVEASREATVGATPVRRALPRRGRRTVGPWCFVDHFGPATVEPDSASEVAPHPHCGLQTVTWLVSGELLHRDSLGTEQTITPGRLNLMTAGRGVSHSEESVGRAEVVHGFQLWVAQPDWSRHGPAAFEHHAALPQVELGGATATVLVGELGGERSPARRDSPLVGAELQVRSAVTVPLEPQFEHALVVLDGTVLAADRAVVPGHLAAFGPGHDAVRLESPDGARVLLIGGEPLAEPILMSWNFVGRTRDELEAAHDAWNAGDDRFGHVDSRLPRTPAPPPVWRMASGHS